MGERHFKVLHGKKEDSFEIKQQRRKMRSEWWRKMYIESESIKKTALCGVKYISHSTQDTNTEFYEFNILITDIEIITRALSMLTYRELQELFPIRKDFDGWKFEAKDYWSTKEWLDGKDADSKIGEDVDEMLWTYYNDDIMSFGIKKILIVDKLRRASGNKSIAEEFIDKINSENPPEKQIHTYSINREAGYIYDKTTGKTQPLKESKHSKLPKYLKVVK